MSEIYMVPRNRRGLYNASLQIVRENSDYQVFIWGYRCEDNVDVIGGDFNIEHLCDQLRIYTRWNFPIKADFFQVHCIEGNEVKFVRNGQKMTFGELWTFLAEETAFRQTDSYELR